MITEILGSICKHAADLAAKNEAARLTGTPALVRRTDEAVASLPLNWPRRKASSIDCHRASLKNAASSDNTPGVYIIYLHGQMMKVGSAKIGIRRRMQQYYGLNSYCGYSAITKENRDDIQVVWQNCPLCKCNELESKLARKYGKGPWADRVPHSSENTWDLLI